MRKTTILFLAVLLLAGVSFAQRKNIDNFKSGSDIVDVFFYDPLLRLFNIDKDFQSRTDKEKSVALDKYLHENPLYLFRLTNAKTGEIRFFCIRGNPEKKNTRMFYKVEVIGNAPSDFDPTLTNFGGKILRVIDQVNIGGTLFENMSLFDDEKNKKFVGNGIQVFGVFYGVVPYSEIKSSMMKIIEGPVVN